VKSKEALRNELLRYADFAWETNSNKLHPLAQLMVEELCNELHLLDNRIENLHQALLDKLVENLIPSSYNYLRCAHTIAYLLPEVPFYLLEKETNFFLKELPAISDYKMQETMMFTPATDVQLSTSAVKRIFFDRTLWKIDNDGDKTPSVQIEKRGKYNTVWIGLSICDEIETLENLCFYLCFPHLDDSHEYYDMLSNIRWSAGNESLEVQQGFPVFKNTPNKTEEKILAYYKDHFQTIKSKIPVDGLIKEKLPEELHELFDAEQIASMLPLHWLSISFPPHFIPADIENISIFLNAFPVINRGYKKHTVSGLEGTEVIPLPMGICEELLEIEEVVDTKNQKYCWADNNKNEKTYNIKKKELEVNAKGLSGYLEQLSDMIQYERRAFSKINEEKIDSVSNAVSVIAYMDAIKTDRNRISETDIVTQLTVNMPENETEITVSYWTTCGELANGIPIQSKLMAHKTSELNNSDATFLTPVTGGYNFYNIDSLKAINRFYVTSKGRILTKNDILNFCWIEIGKYVEAIDAVRSVSISPRFGEGLVNVIEIRITPLADCVDFLKTSGVLKELRLQLERKSPEHFKYQIVISPAS